MKIKMKNEEITQCVDMMRTLGKEKGRLGYAIMRNLRKLDEASSDYRQIKNEAIKKYGETKKASDGTEYMEVPKSSRREFTDEIKDIAAIEEEVDIFTVSEEEFYSGNLTAQQMDKLDWMIEAVQKETVEE